MSIFQLSLMMNIFLWLILLCIHFFLVILKYIQKIIIFLKDIKFQTEELDKCLGSPLFLQPSEKKLEELIISQSQSPEIKLPEKTEEKNFKNFKEFFDFATENCKIIYRMLY